MNHVIRPMSRSLLRMAVPYRAAFFVALSTLLGCFSPACGFARSQAAISAAAMVEGKVRNSAGEPVSGALATLTDSSGKEISQTTSDAHGEFQLSAPQAGAFSLRAEKMGAGKSKLQSIRLAAGERRHVEVVLMKEAADTAAAGIEFADDPGFTVAGVNDGTDVGGHGSDTTRRTSEALARETLDLKSTAEDEAGSPTDSDAARNATAHRVRGEAAERAGDPVGAVREFELAVRADPSEQNYFDWGSELLMHGAPRPAVEVFSNGSKAHPSSSRMLAGLGAALYASGSPEEAARRLCQASDLSPGAPAPYLFLGEIQESSAVPLPCAKEKLARFAQTQPSNALANYYYAVNLVKQTQNSAGPLKAGTPEIKQAQALLEKAVSLDPKLAEAHVQLGALYMARGEAARAIASYQMAVTSKPMLPEAHYRLALAYKRNGENAKAEREFQLYRETQHAETAAVEARRRELRQFLVILKGEPGAPH